MGKTQSKNINDNSIKVDLDKNVANPNNYCNVSNDNTRIIIKIDEIIDSNINTQILDSKPINDNKKISKLKNLFQVKIPYHQIEKINNDIYPYSLLGNIKFILNDYSYIKPCFLIDHNYVMTTFETVSPIIKNQRKTVLRDNLIFIYNSIGYKIKEIHYFNNSNMLYELLFKNLTNKNKTITPIDKDFYTSNALYYLKSSLVVLELEENVDNQALSSLMFKNLLDAIIGNNLKLIRDVKPCLRIITLVREKNLFNFYSHFDKIKIIQLNRDTEFKVLEETIDNFNLIDNSIVEYQLSINYPYGSMLFINDLFVGIHTNCIDNYEDFIPFFKTFNYPHENNYIGYIFQELFIDFNIKIYFDRLNNKNKELNSDQNQLGNETFKLNNCFNSKLFLSSIKILNNIKELDLRSNNLTDVNLYQFSNFFQYMINLALLNLSNNKISSSGIDTLSKNLIYLSNLKLFR